jgi:hypothetical protein
MYSGAILMIAIGVVGMLAGLGLFYAVGTCTRCGKWSVRYVCPSCNRGRYDYTP